MCHKEGYVIIAAYTYGSDTELDMFVPIVFPDRDTAIKYTLKFVKDNNLTLTTKVGNFHIDGNLKACNGEKVSYEFQLSRIDTDENSVEEVVRECENFEYED